MNMKDTINAPLPTLRKRAAWAGVSMQELKDRCAGGGVYITTHNPYGSRTILFAADATILSDEIKPRVKKHEKGRVTL
jgi:hypothetical protein